MLLPQQTSQQTLLIKLNFTDKLYSVYSYFEKSKKVVGKSARDNPERYWGWFWVHCSSKKFEGMAREAKTYVNEC